MLSQNNNALGIIFPNSYDNTVPELVTAVSYTHLRAHETDSYLVCRLLLEKKKSTTNLSLIQNDTQ